MATVTTSGLWTSVSAAIAQLRGVNTNTLSWGVPYPYGNFNPLRRQSSYTFDGVTGAAAPIDGSEFKLGTFTHNNFNLSPPLMLFSTNLRVTMELGGGGSREFNFTFQHNETVNSPGPIPDEVLLPSPQSKETVTLDGVEYALEITGFKQDGKIVSKFISQEDRANSAEIFAKLVAVAKPVKELEPEPAPVKEPEPEPEPAPARPITEGECRLKHVVGVSTVFSAVLERLNRRSVVGVLDQVIAEVNEHCERLPGVNIDVKTVLQQIEALNLRLTLPCRGRQPTGPPSPGPDPLPSESSPMSTPAPHAPLLGYTPCETPLAARGPAPSQDTCAAPPPLLVDPDDALVLSFEEARRILRLSRNTLYRLADAGQIPGARRVGKLWRFRRDLLLEWLSSNAPPPRPRRSPR